MNNRLIPISLFILLLVGGLFVWYKKQSVMPPVVESVTEVISESAPISEPETPIDTSDWQTYRNDKYGFEFRYPGTFRLDERSDLECINTLNCVAFKIFFFDNIQPTVNFWIEVYNEKGMNSNQRVGVKYKNNQLATRTNSRGVRLYGPSPFYHGEEIPASYRETYAENKDVVFLWNEMYSVPDAMREQEKINQAFFLEIVDTFRFLP